MSGDVVESSAANGVILDDATATRDLPTPSLELRFDQQHHLGLWFTPSQEGVSDRTQGDKRKVRHHQVNGATERRRVGITDVSALVHFDPRIASHPLMHLIRADVDSDDPFGPVLQQTIGEATRRGPRIERQASVHIDPELCDGVFEFLTPRLTYFGLSPSTRRAEPVATLLADRAAGAPSTST